MTTRLSTKSDWATARPQRLRRKAPGASSSLAGAGRPGCCGIQPGGSLAGKDSSLASSTGSSTISFSGSDASGVLGRLLIPITLVAEAQSRTDRTQATMPWALMAPAVCAARSPFLKSIMVGMLRIA